MTRAPIRRSQVIVPFGVGGMLVSPDGVSMMGAGLDHWYERETRALAENPDEFRIQEWRLQLELDVDCFRLPPDFRRPRGRESIPNSGLRLPFLRFPRWHVCPKCSRLDERGLTERNRILCRHCEAEGNKRTLHQVPFVAMCDHGHIQDFPFREWVHRSLHPHCTGTMWLYATGGASLGGQMVKCECDQQRSLAGIMNVHNQGEKTDLTNDLAEGEEYSCQGHTPWLGITIPEGQCVRPLRGSLRSAANVYFPQQRGAIYLPRQGGTANSDLISLLEQPPLSTFIQTLVDAGVPIEPKMLRGPFSQHLKSYTDSEIHDGVTTITSKKPVRMQAVPDEDPEITFRRPECKFKLSIPQN